MPDERYDVDKILQEIKERRAAREQQETVPRATAENAKTAFVQPREREADVSRLLKEYSAPSTPPATEPARAALLGFGARPAQPETPAAAEKQAVDALEEVAAAPQTPAAPPTAPTYRASAADDDNAFAGLFKKRDAAKPSPARTQQAPPTPEKALSEDDDWAFARHTKRQTAQHTPAPTPDDFRAIGGELAHTRRSALIALLVTGVCAAAALYLALAPGASLPVPTFLAENVGLYLWVQEALVILSALSCGGMVGGGMLSLFTRRGNNSAYTALAVFACLVQGAYLAMNPELFSANPTLIYLPVAALILFASALAHLVDTDRKLGSCAVCAAGERRVLGAAVLLEDEAISRRLLQSNDEEAPVVAAVTGAGTLCDFEAQADTTSRTEDVSRVVAPIAAAASLVMAVVSYIFNKSIFTAACVFTAALAVSSPLSAALASVLPLYLTNQRVRRWGATYTGYRAAEGFAAADGVLIPCADLFPEGSVTLQGVKVFNKAPVDRTILDAAAVLSACQSPLSGVFAGMIAGTALKTPENLIAEEAMGLSAWVDGRRILVGSRELMELHDIAMPERSFDQRYLEGGKTLLFVATAGQLSAMFIFTYTADKHIRRALSLCASKDLYVLLYTNDPNVNPAALNRLYNLPENLFRTVPGTLGDRAVAGRVSEGCAPAQLVYRGGPASYVRAIAAARSCRGVITAQAVLVLLSVIFGFALVTFMAFTGAIGTLTWSTILLFHLFWTGIELFIALIKR